MGYEFLSECVLMIEFLVDFFKWDHNNILVFLQYTNLELVNKDNGKSKILYCFTLFFQSFKPFLHNLYFSEISPLSRKLYTSL